MLSRITLTLSSMLLGFYCINRVLFINHFFTCYSLTTQLHDESEILGCRGLGDKKIYEMQLPILSSYLFRVLVR